MLEIEKLSKQSGNTDASITNRIQEMEDRISNVEDTIEEIDSTVKENTKTKKAIKQNVQEIWDTMKRPNIRIIGIEEGEEYQLKAYIFHVKNNLFHYGKHWYILTKIGVKVRPVMAVITHLPPLDAVAFTWHQLSSLCTKTEE
ncbi:hypothetical protein STEG23_026440 [Scotinomys teguina]